MTCIFLVDTEVFQQYRFHLNGALVSLFFSGDSDEIFEFSLRMKLEVALLVLIVAVGHWLIARRVWRGVTRTPQRRYGYAAATAGVLLLLATNVFHAYADAVGHTDVTRQTQLLPLYQPLMAKDFLERHGLHVVQSSNPGGAAYKGSLDYPRAPLDLHTPAEKPNIVFILVDSWRADAMNAQVTPNIAAFAAGNQRFMNHYSGGNATRAGVFTLFYGIPGTYWQSALQTGTRPVLINRMLDLGYRFGIFPSAPLSFPEFNRTIFAGMPDLRMRARGHNAPDRDIDANRGLIDFLKRGDHEKPFFGMIFYDAPHAYDLPDDAPRPFQPSWKDVNYLSLNADTDPTGLHNLYRNSVHFVDGLVADLLRTLRAQGFMKNTIVVITGDHGQEFNDLGLNYWGHNGDFSRFQTHVPMIVHWPGESRPGRRISHLTSHFDVAPTLLDHALGVDNAYPATSVGHDLFEPADRLPLVMAKYRSYAAMTKNGFVAFRAFGPVEVLDRDYRRRDTAPSPGVIRETLDQLRRFRSTD